MKLIYENIDKNKIDIVIPTFNEEKNLENFVNYYKDFNIIILDDNSTDNTLKIAHKLKCTVYLRNREIEPNSVAPTEYAVYFYIHNFSKSGFAIKLDIDELIDKDYLKILSLIKKDCKLNFVKERIEIIWEKKIKLFKSQQPLLLNKNNFKCDPLSLHSGIYLNQNIQEFNYIPVYHTGNQMDIERMQKIISYINVERRECLLRNKSYFLFAIKRYLIPCLLFPLRFFRIIFFNPRLYLFFILNRYFELFAVFSLIIEKKFRSKM